MPPDPLERACITPLYCVVGVPSLMGSDEDDDTLLDALDRVQDRETFLDFVRALVKDKEDEDRKEAANPSSPWGPGANGWENGNIAQYLDAALAWGESISGETHMRSLPQEPSWKAFAEFLYCGKIYE